MTPRQLLAKARIETFTYMPYAASFVYALHEHETPGIGTAAVSEDGRLFWDPEFINKIGREKGAYLILHETLHLVLEHHARAKEIIGENADEFHRYVCNVAADLVIEQTLHMMRHLRPEGAVYLGCEIPSWGITLDLPENKSLQEYYRLILEKLKSKADTSPDIDDDTQEEESDGGDDSSDAGDEQSDEENEDGSGGEDGSNDGGEQADSGSAGCNSGQQPLDEESQLSGSGDDADFVPNDDTTGSGHASSSGGEGQHSAGKGKELQKPGSPGSGGSCADGQRRPYETESDGAWEAFGSDMAAARTLEAIATHEQSHPGTVPGNIKAALRQKLRPQPDPFDQLRSAVCTSVASPVGGRDFSRRRRSRKQPLSEDAPLLHGRITVQPHVVVIVDTSGSMMNRDTMARALAVIGQGIRKLSRVKVFCADTHVRSHASVATTKTFDWCGGGGTNMARAIEEVDRTDKPDSIILITDAETGWPDKKPHARVVVAYTGSVGSSWHQRIPSWCRTVALQGGGNA
jgi:predicted metal-dependent peptidase